MIEFYCQRVRVHYSIFHIQSLSPRMIALHFSERGVIEHGYGKGVLGQLEFSFRIPQCIYQEN